MGKEEEKDNGVRVENHFADSADAEPAAKKPHRSCREVCSNIEGVLRRLVPLLLLILYSFFGAFIFHITEEPAELDDMQQTVNDIKGSKLDLAHAIDKIYYGGVDRDDGSNFKSTLRLSRFTEAQSKIEAFMNDLDVEEPTPEDGSVMWGFWGSMFYSMTLYTTIGYGYQSPLTTRGRILTCIYSLIGIPLCLFALVEIGYLFTKFLRWLFGFCVSVGSCGQKKADFNNQGDQGESGGNGSEEMTRPQTTEADDDNDLLNFPVSILIFVTIGWLLICAGIFMAFEDWSYGTSLYFTFISFTTIGLGDVAPNEYGKMVLTSLLVLIGLALVSTTITMIQQMIEALVKKMKRETEAQFAAAIMDEQGGQAMQPDGSMSKLLGKMPGSSKLLFKFVPEKDVNRLKKEYEKKARKRNAGVQTDMKMLQKGNKLVAVQELDEDLKSRDDTNSLVMMCDYPI